MRIAVIPARSGSRRIPGKNLKPFLGKPIIGWAIDSALSSRLFDRVVVSTEAQAIADVAVSFGAEIPFLRPRALADEHTPTAEVMGHAVTTLLDGGGQVELACCIYPTSVFVETGDLAKGLEVMLSGDWSYVFSAVELTPSIFRSFRLAESGGVEMLYPKHQATRTQDLPKIYHDAAQFYWGTRQSWIDQKAIFGPCSKPVIIPSWRVQDIDTPEDWKRAELLKKMLIATSKPM